VRIWVREFGVTIRLTGASGVQDAPAIFIGEQPGNGEDLTGLPLLGSSVQTFTHSRIVVDLAEFRVHWPLAGYGEGEAFLQTLKIGNLLRPHGKALALGLLAVIGEGCAALLQPWPLKIVLDNVLHSQSLHGHGWLNLRIQSITGGDPITTLKFAAGAALTIAIVGALCSYLEKSLTTSVGQWVMHDLRRKLYSHIQKLSLSYHDHKQTGDLISRVTSDIDAIQAFIASGLLGALVNILTLGGMVGVMFYLNWRFTLIALSVAPILFAVAYSYTRRIKKASREVRKKEGEIVSVIQEVLTSIRVVKAFAREEYEQRRFEEESLESVEIALRARGMKARLSPLVEVIVAIGTSLVLWFGAKMVLAGALSAGTLILFIFYLGKMYKPMQDLSKMTDSYSKASVGYERIIEILNTHDEVPNLPGARIAPRFQGRIEFDKVSFSYEPASPVLRDVSFGIEPGETAALVGPTGAGKTTIVSLIARFYDPASGSVKIDGRDVRMFTQKSLHQQISFVLQETILFHGPIWHNIAYGKPGASRAEILRAAELANAREFIEKMPEGYNTIVGERGITLSGGQRQRIAIARAVIRNTPILILDEPSSGLDAGSEKHVFEALDRLMEGKTSIVIAHRLSTIRRADIILVVNEGTIIESGRHEQLVNAGGLYGHLYDLQFRAEEELTNR
jgi:ATP-binding cassette subfamily B protein